MFGTIGIAKLKPGSETALDGLTQDWMLNIRPKVPGAFSVYIGHRVDQPQQLVFIALAQNRATYEALAQLPEQDAWFRRLIEHVEGEVIWDDIQVTGT